MKSFLGNNPTRERRQREKRLALRGSKDLSLTGHVPSHSAHCLHLLSLALCLSPTLSFALSVSPPICPLPPFLPLFFRHEPCVIKQLGGAAERRMVKERERELAVWRSSCVRKKGGEKGMR